MDAQEALARSASVISLTDVLATQNVVFSSSKIQAWINRKLFLSGSSSGKYSILLGWTDPECGAHSPFIIILAFCLLCLLTQRITPTPEQSFSVSVFFSVLPEILLWNEVGTQ